MTGGDGPAKHLHAQFSQSSGLKTATQRGDSKSPCYNHAGGLLPKSANTDISTEVLNAQVLLFRAAVLETISRPRLRISLCKRAMPDVHGDRCWSGVACNTASSIRWHCCAAAGFSVLHPDTLHYSATNGGSTPASPGLAATEPVV